MATVVVEVEDEALDKLIVNDLKTQYKGNSVINYRDDKLLEALKHVIEYYVGSIDDA